MSPAENSEAGQILRFPRVSGDEPSVLRATRMSATFSPRERG